MKVQVENDVWINTRFILNYFPDGNTVKVKMLNGDEHIVYYHDGEVTSHVMEQLIKFISSTKLNTHTLQKDAIYKYMKV